MAGYFEILCSIAALLFVLYYYSTYNLNFWKKQGVIGPKPIPFFGTTLNLMFALEPIPEYTQKLYQEYKNEQMVGLYACNTPVLLIRDPELIKNICIRDFSKFADRGFNVSENAEPLTKNLVNLEPKRWRPLRSKLSPIFTSGKLREMFGLILVCSEHFNQYLEKVAAKREAVDIRELTAKFTTDVIGSCVFGIDMNAVAEEDSEFRKMGRDIFAPTLLNTFRVKCNQFLPKFYDIVGRLLPDKRTPFFMKMVTESMAYRTENNIHRPDFIHLLMELKSHPLEVGDIELTDSLLCAQAFIFFAAGFETSATTMSNALYELAQNHDIQDRLRDEIREYSKAGNGDLKYDDVKRMEYLDKVFKETLRKYPPGSMIPRKATADYTFDDGKVTILKDMRIWIPVFAIHRDPEIYPNPDVFDPERFNEDAVQARHPMHYLPFGDGPRNCIGSRFAIYQTKVGLITMLRKYKVDICEKTVIPYKFSSGTFVLTPNEAIYLTLIKLTN